MADNTNLPSYKRPELEAVEEDLDLIRDELGGTRAMHDNSTKYIRQWGDEDNDIYNIRRVIEEFFEGLGRTLSASIGMLFAKEPSLEWNQSETAMSPVLDNVDAGGTAFNVFLKRFSERAIRDGIALILTDHPSPPADTEGKPVLVTAANEKQLGLRPTWAMYERGQAISWRTAKINNRQEFTQLVLSESAEVEDGEFGISYKDRYRVLRLVNGQATWTLYEATTENPTKIEDFVVVGQGVFRNRKGQVADFLPISVAYAGRTDSPMTATIPLLGVAWANLGHWRQSTNLRFYRELCAFPQPTITGELASDPQTGRPTTLKMGPAVAVQVAEGATFTWTELQGTSMEQLEKGIAEKEHQMAQLGMSFLAKDTRAAETAEAKRLDASSENATLATSAQGIEDAGNMSLEHLAWFMGIEKAGAPVVSISRDYEATTLEAQMIQAYAALVNAGFPKQPVVDALVAGGVITTEDPEALAMEWEAGQAAEAEQQALQAQARMTDNKKAA